MNLSDGFSRPISPMLDAAGKRARRKSFSSDMPSAAIIQKLTIQIPGPDPDELLGAATKGEPSTVAQLLADTWPASGLLDDALVLACTGGHMDVALQLILHGAAIDPVAVPKPPFYCACEKGHVDLVRELLRRGATLDRVTPEGETALGCSAFCGQSAVVQLLIERRASLEATMQSETPFGEFSPRQRAEAAKQAARFKGAADWNGCIALLLQAERKREIGQVPWRKVRRVVRLLWGYALYWERVHSRRRQARAQGEDVDALTGLGYIPKTISIAPPPPVPDLDAELELLEAERKKKASQQELQRLRSEQRAAPRAGGKAVGMRTEEEGGDAMATGELARGGVPTEVIEGQDSYTPHKSPPIPKLEGILERGEAVEDDSDEEASDDEGGMPYPGPPLDVIVEEEEYEDDSGSDSPSVIVPQKASPPSSPPSTLSSPPSTPPLDLSRIPPPGTEDEDGDWAPRSAGSSGSGIE